MPQRYLSIIICCLFMTCLAINPGAFVCAQDITSNLVAHWKFDENTGTSAADSSGNSNTGTISGATWNSSGVEGSCLDFDGVFDYVSIVNSASLQISGDITISAWVNADSISGQHCIVGHGPTSSSVQNTYLFAWLSSWLGGSHQSGNDEYASASISSGDVGSWVHIAIVYDDEDWFLYRNGTQIDSHEAEDQGAVNVSSSRWAIGAASSLSARFFDGLIDEVRIYGRALSSSDVTEIYNTENSSSSSSSGGSLYLSTGGGATLGGFTFEDEDIVNYDADADSSTRIFEGDIVYSSDEETNGIHIRSDGKILLTPDNAATIGALSFNDEDIVEYDPDTGTATMFFDGSTVDSSIGELNAISVLDNGNIVISTTASASIGALSFNDDDLVEYNPSTGTATMLLDGSTVITNESDEGDRDIDGVHVFSNGQMLLSTSTNSSINGLQFGDDDVVLYDPGTGNATMYFDGGNLFSSSSEDVDGVSLVGGVGGLVGHWLLDETSGTTATDSSGLGNDGSYISTPTLGDTGPFLGRGLLAATFNGSTERVDVADDSSMNPTETVSLAAWVKLDATPNANKGIISKYEGSGDNRQYALIVEGTTSPGRVNFVISPDGTSNNEVVIQSSASLPVGDWAHVVATYEAGVAMRIYVNGVLETEITSSLPASIHEGTAPLWIGCHDSTSATNHFDGSIFDARVYDVALTPPEIATIYGLVGHWQLEEASGTTATDSSLNANNGTHNSGVTVGQTGPYSGVLAADYDGSNNFTDVPYGGNWNPVDNEFSLATWVRIDAGSDTHGLIIWSNNASPYALRTNSSDQVVLRTNWGTVSGESGEFTHNSTASLSVGQWYHVAATYDGSTTRIYIDGVEDSTHSATITIGTSTDKMQIGGDDGSSYDLTGAMYDARIYNRALSADEVNNIAATPTATGLVGHWKLDETSGTLAADSSGNGHDGTHENGVSVGQTGVRSYGSGFDGVDDGVRITHHSDFNITDAITVATWVKFNSLSGWQRIISKSTDYAFQLRLKGDTGTIGLECEGLSGIKDIELIHDIPLDEWIHVVGVYDGTNIKIYYNGQLDNQASASGSITTDASSDVMLGNRGTGGSPLNGCMDDARIYNYALDDQAIAELYGLIGHWNMDEATGSTLADGTAFNNDATLNGATWTTDCVGRSALAFDGVDDTAVTGSNFDPPEMGAVAFWFQSKGQVASRQRPWGVNADFESWIDTNGLMSMDVSTDGFQGGFITTERVDDEDRWYHVVALYDSSDESYAIYLNGELHKSGISTWDIQDQAEALLTFGTRTGSIEYWEGALRDFRIYNRHLTDTEIAKLSGLIARWNFEESSGSVAVDSGVLQNDATYVSSPTLGVEGPFISKTGSAVELDGSLEYVDSGESLLNDLSEFTLSGWIRPDSISPSQSFFGQNDVIELGINTSSNRIDLWTANGGTINATVPIGIGKWNHIAAVGSGTELVLYLNGIEVASGGSSTSNYGNNSSHFRIGEGVFNPSGDLFDGRFDDVRAYSRAMCPEEIYRLYKGGRPDGIRIIRWLETR